MVFGTQRAEGVFQIREIPSNNTDDDRLQKFALRLRQPLHCIVRRALRLRESSWRDGNSMMNKQKNATLYSRAGRCGDDEEMTGPGGVIGGGNARSGRRSCADDAAHCPAYHSYRPSSPPRTHFADTVSSDELVDAFLDFRKISSL